MLLKDKTIAIIGGGPGGLTLARLLQLKGVKVKVYERDENREVRVQGATLDIHHDSGLKALEAAGLMDVFKATYRPGNDHYRILDQNGTIFHDDRNKPTTGGFGDEWFRPEIDRGPLRNMLLDSLQPETVVWDSHIISLEKLNEGWQLVFKNGLKATADVVIGADGANSGIRPFLTPTEPHYSGIIYLVGNIQHPEKHAPNIHQLVQGGKIIALHDSHVIFASAKGDGSLDFYISWKAEEHWAADGQPDLKNSAATLEWFKTEFSGWDSLWYELLDHENNVLIPRPLYSMPSSLSWLPSANITLIGDAAHVLPPNGEGVNQAMLDALELSECLTEGTFNEVSSAIAHYEKLMFSRFVRVEEETRELNDAMFSENGVAQLVNMLNPDEPT